MKLADLNPTFFDYGGEGVTKADGSPVPRRSGVGMIFDCPCGKCGVQAQVEFSLALDGEPWRPKTPTWTRMGDSFDTMTLSPSIHRAERLGGCGWHGWVRNGNVISV